MGILPMIHGHDARATAKEYVNIYLGRNTTILSRPRLNTTYVTVSRIPALWFIISQFENDTTRALERVEFSHQHTPIDYDEISAGLCVRVLLMIREKSGSCLKLAADLS